MRSVWYGYSVRIVIRSRGLVPVPRRLPKIAASPNGCLPPVRAKL